MNCQLLDKKWLYRKFFIVTQEGLFVVEYCGRGLGYERVRVNGVPVAGGISKYWYIPRFQFGIGSKEGILNVRVYPWLTIRTISLMVEHREIYAE